MFCYVYVLKSETTDKHYIGFTTNLKQRLAEHNSGSNRSTKPGMPWRLIYYEAHLSKEDAIRREKYIKTSQGHKALTMTIRSSL